MGKQVVRIVHFDFRCPLSCMLRTRAFGTLRTVEMISKSNSNVWGNPFSLRLACFDQIEKKQRKLSAYSSELMKETMTNFMEELVTMTSSGLQVLA